jgi:sigma-B regulation protein RsbU (phosphoserine phosphatase)
LKVLIAEDDFISSQVLQNHLEKWGHEVIASATGAEAWRRFQQEEFACVISDWMMPEMDGLELVRRIRAADRPGYVYIILLTAKSKKEDIVRGMEAGADDFLVKPFDREELRVRLRAGERIVRLEQNLARQNEELQAANAHISAANRRMQRDLDAAVKVQNSLLPTSLPDFPDAQFAWAFRPCEELAGDSLGIVGLDDRHAGLYVLDVSGHGVAAALSSVSVRHFLSPVVSTRSLLRRAVPGSTTVRIASPAEVADELNRQFPMDPVTGQYLTLIYGVLDLGARLFRYVSAGHPPPLLLPHGRSCLQLEASGFPIGVVEQTVYAEQAVTLEPGDRLYLYSDGVPEAFNPHGEQFGMSRLMETMEANRRQSLEESLSDLLRRIDDWGESLKRVDDISILGVEISDNRP